MDEKGDVAGAGAAPGTAAGGLDWSRIGFAAIFIGFIISDFRLVQEVLARQPLGVDFAPIWSAMRAQGSQVYDFLFVTQQQSWFYSRDLRPFVYPPSAIPVLWPFGFLPFTVAYPAFVLLTASLYLHGARRIGADWRIVLLPPVAILVALAGQVTFLVGGLVMTGLSLQRRSVLSGILFGVAGALKPQMLVLLPLALMAERNWRTIGSTAATAGLLALVTIPFGASWLEWIGALTRFHELVQNDATLIGMSATPYAAWGPGSFLVTVPVAALAVWFSFRQADVPRRVLALLGGAIFISPYALIYEVALLVPAILALERKPRWTLMFWIALGIFTAKVWAVTAAMLLVLRDLAGERQSSRLRNVTSKLTSLFRTSSERELAETGNARPSIL